MRHMEHGTQAKDMWECLVTSREPGRQLPEPSPVGSLQEAHPGPGTEFARALGFGRGSAGFNVPLHTLAVQKW